MTMRCTTAARLIHDILTNSRDRRLSSCYISTVLSDLVTDTVNSTSHTKHCVCHHRHFSQPSSTTADITMEVMPFTDVGHRLPVIITCVLNVGQSSSAKMFQCCAYALYDICRAWSNHTQHEIFRYVTIGRVMFAISIDNSGIDVYGVSMNQDGTLVKVDHCPLYISAWSNDCYYSMGRALANMLCRLTRVASTAFLSRPGQALRPVIDRTNIEIDLEHSIPNDAMVQLDAKQGTIRRHIQLKYPMPLHPNLDELPPTTEVPMTHVDGARSDHIAQYQSTFVIHNIDTVYHVYGTYCWSCLYVSMLLIKSHTELVHLNA